MVDERFLRPADEGSPRAAGSRRSREVSIRAIAPLRDFLRTESSGALLLVFAAAVAVVLANSPWASSYESFWSHTVQLSFADWGVGLDLRHWVNDGLMTLFFLVVGLEIKRELTDGHLKSIRAALLPCLAAVAGMLAPALIYLAIAGGVEPRGWAIPVATDIALAVGVLTLVSSRIPSGARVFLLTLAIVDDIGAIVIIAVLFSKGTSPRWLGAAVACVALSVMLRALKVNVMVPYLVLGSALWLALHESGVHPTMAGVIMGLLTPSTPLAQSRLVDIENPPTSEVQAIETSALDSGSNPTDRAGADLDRADGSVSIAEWLQHRLHPYTSLLVVPLFALANSGITLSFEALVDAMSSPLGLGVFFGLVVGKPVGIFVSTFFVVRLRISEMPSRAQPRHIFGVGSAAGIGFTVAMFVTELALSNEQDVAQAKISIFAAAICSAIVALVILRSNPSVHFESEERQ
ncbi:MAG: Na+/H+ antiporter NhaA [Actinobacteria bacterium]|nr:Na+/H+ antiporter NhaA [Actinomycetota bacterium]NDG77028.1 Na+/H+ antiporter NhaA [Acidimicrobiia bacterium]NBO33820.1 Na+/H+ antiporter NhaA [Actinomycetota bacterium]NBP17689.1 Na+/H+ antiporter NhaA [Actinomycetota bacterium]NBR76601.1 Na+/H+ antiporter NhaA [Actinomycetota bacterium]